MIVRLASHGKTGSKLMEKDYAFLYIILLNWPITIRGRYYYFFHFIDKKFPKLTEYVT